MCSYFNCIFTYSGNHSQYIGHNIFKDNAFKYEYPDDMMSMALPYLQIYFLGLAPNLIYNMGAGLLRAVGDSKTPLIFRVISCFVNIVLDIILIRYMNMGVTGAAIATVTSQIISAVLVIIVLYHRNDALKLRLKSYK